MHVNHLITMGKLQVVRLGFSGKMYYNLHVLVKAPWHNNEVHAYCNEHGQLELILCLARIRVGSNAMVKYVG